MGWIMHELGVLRQVVKTVSRAAEQNRIGRVKYVALEVGRSSGFVPRYLTKLFPVAADSCSLLKNAQLTLSLVPGSGLVIKEIGYER